MRVSCRPVNRGAATTRRLARGARCAAAQPATEAAEPQQQAGYRWSRSENERVEERIHQPVRSQNAPEEEAEADSGGIAPPPPPAWFSLLGAAAAPAAPPAAPAKKGFGGGAAAAKKGFGAAPKPAAAAAAAPDRSADAALLALSERRFTALLEWERVGRVARRSFVLSARWAGPAQDAPSSLSDWLPIAELLLVDGAQLSGAETYSISAAPALAAALPSSQLAPLLLAALRRAAGGASKRLIPSALAFAFESSSSFDAALAAARSGGGSRDEVTAAQTLLGVSAAEAGDRAAVRGAYRRAAAASHPDRLPEGSAEQAEAASTFAKVQAAYELLTTKAATGSGAAAVARAARGYEAWDASKRDFEHIPSPADWADGAAAQAAARAAGAAAGGFGVAAQALPQELVSFFALRNTVLSKQAAAAEGKAAAAAA